MEVLRCYKTILQKKIESEEDLLGQTLMFDNLYQEIPEAVCNNQSLESVEWAMELLREYGLIETAFNKKYPASQLMVKSLQGGHYLQHIDIGDIERSSSSDNVDPREPVAPLLTVLCRYNVETKYVRVILDNGYPQNDEFLTFKLPNGVTKSTFSVNCKT